MFVSEAFSVNRLGHLTIGGADALELAARFGTPCYVIDEKTVRANCRAYVDSFKEHYDGHGRPIYATKALNCVATCRLAVSEGMGLDCVSGGEIFTALTAGVDPKLIYFHGSNKTLDELEYAISSGIGRIMVDNFYELENIERIAGRLGKKADVIVRAKPGIDASTHEYIRTGQIDSKFGLDIYTGEAMEAVKRALAYPNLELHGVHCHIGSQIFEIDPFADAAKVMIGFIADIKKETGYECEELDVGGGFGIKYTGRDDPPALGEYMKKIASAIKAECAKLGVKPPFVIIEPGRSVIGSAGATLYTVGAIKEIPGIRTYVSIDGGMGDNPRYMLYGSSYELLCANRADEPKTEVITLAGRCCESGDMIQENAPIQPVEPGDIVAVLSTGAYNFSMSSNYNRIPRPPVVFVNDGEATLAVRRQSYEDLLINDVI